MLLQLPAKAPGVDLPGRMKYSCAAAAHRPVTLLPQAVASHASGDVVDDHQQRLGDFPWLRRTRSHQHHGIAARQNLLEPEAVDSAIRTPQCVALVIDPRQYRGALQAGIRGMEQQRGGGIGKPQWFGAVVQAQESAVDPGLV